MAAAAGSLLSAAASAAAVKAVLFIVRAVGCARKVRRVPRRLTLAGAVTPLKLAGVAVPLKPMPAPQLAMEGVAGHRRARQRDGARTDVSAAGFREYRECM